MTNGLLDRVEFAVYGNRVYNLEIKLTTEPVFPRNRKQIRNIKEYTGLFIVTEKGYLVKGSEDNLPKSNAKIIDDEISPPVNILYENGHICQIIKRFGNLKLVDTCRLIQREREICFV